MNTAEFSRRSLVPRLRSVLLAALALFVGTVRIAPAQPPSLATVFDETLALPGGSPTLFPAQNEISFYSAPMSWSAGSALMSTYIRSQAPYASIDGITFMGPSKIYFSLNSDARLGGVSIADEDVVLWNAATLSFSVVWKGTTHGLPASVDLDALDVIAVSPLEFSFSLDSDIVLTVGGNPTYVADEDVVRYKEGFGFTQMDFVGSQHGVPAYADLDVFSRTGTGKIAISFNVPGVIPGAHTVSGQPLSFDDADLLSFNIAAQKFDSTLLFNAAAAGVPPNADLRAAEANASLLVPPVTASPTPSPTPSISPSPSASPTPSPTPFDDALGTGSSIPAQIPATHDVPVTITMQNAGNTAWTQGGGYSLSVVSDGCGLAPGGSIPLDVAVTVAPGDSFVFAFTLNGRTTLGGCSLQFRMTGPMGLFGATVSASPQIVAATNGADFVSTTIPSTMYEGTSLIVGVTLHNSGNTTWIPGSPYALAKLADSCSALGGASRFPELYAVAPGQQHQFQLAITVPAAPGSCTLQLQMVEESVAFFGATVTKTINVVPRPNAAEDWTIFE